MKSYSFIQNIPEYFPRGLRNTLGVILLGSLAVLQFAREGSNNLTRHLKNPSEIALESPYDAAIEFLRQYKQPIIEYSKKHTMPLELIAATLIRENHRRIIFDDFKDWLATGKKAYFWDTYVLPITQRVPLPYKPGFLDEPTNPSLGPGQIQVCTAAALDKKFGIEPVGREALEELLQKSNENIMYVTLAWTDLMSQSNRLLPVPNANIFDYPELIGVLGTEYTRGTTGTKLRDAGPSKKGRELLSLLASTNFKDIFGEHSALTDRQQQGMKDYLKKQEHSGVTQVAKKADKQKRPMRKSRC